MPPKRRRQDRHPSPEPESRRQPTPPADPASNQTSEDEDEDDATQYSPLPFYGTTFSAHRVSPLYLGPELLTPNRLQLLAQHLRDKLVGDVVRGVEVGVADREDSIIGRAGALERVELSWVGVADMLGLSSDDLENMRDEEDATSWRQAARMLHEKPALHIALRYEMASCTALMLPPLLGATGISENANAETQFWVGDADVIGGRPRVNSAHFLSLPLLLLRMPAPLKTIVCDFLATTFDCRVSPMRLGTRSLAGSWEAWIKSAGLPSRGLLAKDVVLSLGFYVPPSNATPAHLSDDDAALDLQQRLGIKSIDVIIPAGELRKFAAAGKRAARSQSKQAAPSAGQGWEGNLKKRRNLAGRLYEEGWEWRTVSPGEGNPLEHQPFTEALACYLKEHLGINLFHPGVRVIKIACGGFAMSESRLKLFAPAGSGDAEGEGMVLLAQKGAALELLGRLADKAQMKRVSG